MIKRAFSFVASLVVVAAMAGCAQSFDSEETEEEDVGSVQQALPKTGFYRMYYSDSTLTESVGWKDWQCEPDYRTQEGEVTQFYQEYRYACPGYSSPFLPECTQCVTYSAGGQSWQSCASNLCSQPPPW